MISWRADDFGLPGVRKVSLVAHDNYNHILATLVSDIVNPPRYCLKACSIYSGMGFVINMAAAAAVVAWGTRAY